MSPAPEEVPEVSPPPGEEDELGARRLVRAAVGGDRSAMRELLGSVAPLVARAVRRVLGDRHPDLDDVAQQALAGFVEGLPGFRHQSSLAHFAQRIAVYRALTARRDARARARLSEVTTPEQLDERATPAPGPLASALEGARRLMLSEALEELPEKQAEALALHFLFDHTIAEIAGMLGVPGETVRSRLRLGKQALRARIESDARLATLRENESEGER